MPALKQGLKTSRVPAFNNQTRHPGYFFHRLVLFCEKAAFEPHRSADRATPTSPVEVGY